ncbi:unnamed protein product [Caenorhabditis nigoni]
MKGAESRSKDGAENFFSQSAISFDFLSDQISHIHLLPREMSTNQPASTIFIQTFPNPPTTGPQEKSLCKKWCQKLGKKNVIILGGALLLILAWSSGFVLRGAVGFGPCH